MTEVHLLPTRTDVGDACRHLLVLSKAVADGVDLGPRGFHIQANGRELEALAIELKQQHDALQAVPGAKAPELVLLLDRILALAESIEKLIAHARALST